MAVVAVVAVVVTVPTGGDSCGGAGGGGAKNKNSIHITIEATDANKYQLSKAAASPIS